jgi:hypothetical protein
MTESQLELAKLAPPGSQLLGVLYHWNEGVALLHKLGRLTRKNVFASFIPGWLFRPYDSFQGSIS